MKNNITTKSTEPIEDLPILADANEEFPSGSYDSEDEAHEEPEDLEGALVGQVPSEDYLVGETVTFFIDGEMRAKYGLNEAMIEGVDAVIESVGESRLPTLTVYPNGIEAEGFVAASVLPASRFSEKTSNTWKFKD